MSRVGSALPSRDPLGYPNVNGLQASGGTDPGLQREVNEDRFHCDPDRGIFMVIDGVGGQAAGGRAADVAHEQLRKCLDDPNDSAADAIHGGITTANNEIYRLAATRDEWRGMACVLTVAVVNNGMVTFGHVGDTRLYKLRADCIEKLTRDHSPVGEREDANEISERQAMLHPRRNEVYRDVGSEPHKPSDRHFIDVGEVTFERDAALLLCSDGLTDLVDSASIARTVAQYAGDPDAVVEALIRAANTAGGKDNVTVVYVEGDRFAASGYGRTAVRTRTPSFESVGTAAPAPRPSGRLRVVRAAIVTLLAGLAIFAVLRTTGWASDEVWKQPVALLKRLLPLKGTAAPVLGQNEAQIAVAAGESIADAVRTATAGSVIIVDPGEYREQIALKSGVRLLSRVPRAAIIRLPAAVPDAANVSAVTARNVSAAEIVGFRISGDSATPLPVGILLEDSSVFVVDVEISGATKAAVEFGGGSSTLMASDIRDNPGAAVIVRAGDTSRITHSTFVHNGTSNHPAAAFIVERGATPSFARNIFQDLTSGSFPALDDPAFAALKRDNWFLPSTARSDRTPASARASADK